MNEYYDYELEEKKDSELLLWFLRAFGILFFSLFIFFFNTQELQKPSQTEFGASQIVKTAFSFLTEKENYIKGEKQDRVNILFLGMPGKENSAPHLTDSIMLISIRPSTNQLAVLSIPRDLLVYLKKEKRYAKINSLFIINEKDPKLIEEKVKQITGQEINYYIALDITAVEKVIDILGGLNVFVSRDVYDPRFPTPGFGTEVFEIKKGWRYLDGKTVQKYLRTRNSPNGDFSRMEQQQAVVEAIRKKMFGLNLFLDLPTIFSIFKTMSDHTQTDISNNEIKRLYTLIKNVSYDKIENKVLNGGSDDSLLVADEFMFGSQRGFVLKPKAGDFDYSEIQSLANSIFR